MSDLISRNRAISILEQLNEHSLNGKMDISNAIYLLENQPTAYDIDKVVKELEKELSIADREKERCARENPLQFDSAKGYAHGVGNSIEIVKQEAEQCNNGWIPCSERLPNNFTDCLVTLENGAVFQAKYIIDEFKMVCEHEVTGFYENNNVIAWQPLPQPYKERE